MRDKYFYEVMFDDTSIDVSKEVGLVWSIANSLRGAYTSDKYKDVIILSPWSSSADLSALWRLPKMQLWQSTSRTPTYRLRSFARFLNTPFTIPVNLPLNAFWMTATILQPTLSPILKGFPPIYS